MRVDIVDVARLHARLPQRHLHRAERARPFRMRRRHVIGVARQAVADHLGIDLGAARLGMLIFLEHHHARTLAHDEAVAILVVGAAGLFRRVVEPGGESARLREAGDAERADRALRAARQHHVGIVHRDHARCIADRVRAGRAGGDHRVVGAHQPIFDRDLARDQVDQPAVDEMRRDAARPLFEADDRLALDPRQAADARADRAAGAQPLLLAHLGQPRILQRLAGGIDAVDDERIDLALDLVIDTLARIEAVGVVGGLHLAGDAALLVARVEARDRPRAGLAGEDVGPGGLHIRTQRGDEAQSGDDDATHGNLSASLPSPPRRRGPMSASTGGGARGGRHGSPLRGDDGPIKPVRLPDREAGEPRNSSA